MPSQPYAFICLLAVCAAVPAQDQSDVRVPIKRVVLYKNGVGYFEHLGRVRGNQDVSIAFTTGQLNDVLKSLTVLDMNGGRVTGVTYGSEAPVDRQLSDLRLTTSDKPALAEFLGGLRGARLEVGAGTGAVSGRLLSVERKPRAAGNTAIEADYITVITDRGELRTAELAPGTTVRLLEAPLTGKVGRYLDLVSSAREPDLRRMQVSTAGTGERSLYLSYISEVPVWKTTYRVVLRSKPGQGPLLQGWAIVDNTVGQDWDAVELSLVAGAPQSFIQKLSQPYYTRRPVVPLPEAYLAAPQTFESTLIPGAARLTGVVTDPSGGVVPGVTVRAVDENGQTLGTATTNAVGAYRFDSLAEGNVRVEFTSPGFHTAVANIQTRAGGFTQQDMQLQVGAVAQAVEVASGAPRAKMFSPPPPMAARMPSPPAGLAGAAEIDRVRRQVESAALAQAAGDLFEYKLREPITVKKNQSAMVPIVQSEITAEKVSIWNPAGRVPKPQRALWLTNSTKLTLDGGSFTVLEDETFTGEGLLEAVRPGEKRLVSYAVDLALTPGSEQSNAPPQRVSRVRINRGVMIQESQVQEKKTYTFRNEDTEPRTVIVEHPVRAGYELRGDLRPVETTAAWMRFRLEVPAKQTVSLPVEEVRPIESTFAITNITSDQIALFVRQGSLNKDLEDALRKVVSQKEGVARLEEQKQDRETEIQKISSDQQRIRENLKALKGSAEEKALVQRYTRQLDEQETRIETLRKEIAAIEKNLEAAQAELDKMIEQLSFDVKL